jgi:hypothetical protein
MSGSPSPRDSLVTALEKGLGFCLKLSSVSDAQLRWKSAHCTILLLLMVILPNGGLVSLDFTHSLFICPSKHLLPFCLPRQTVRPLRKVSW